MSSASFRNIKARRKVKFSMNIMDEPEMADFRNDSNTICTKVYKQKYAYLPTKLDSGVWVFLRKYYTIQNIWDSKNWREDYHGHPDKPMKIDEEDYLFRKLADTR